VSGQLHTLAILPPGKEFLVQSDKRLGGLQSQSGCSGRGTAGNQTLVIQPIALSLYCHNIVHASQIYWNFVYYTVAKNNFSVWNISKTQSMELLDSDITVITSTFISVHLYLQTHFHYLHSHTLCYFYCLKIFKLSSFTTSTATDHSSKQYHLPSPPKCLTLSTHGT
jgi:hypothetical protein